MGLVSSHIIKKMRRFNVENRAFRAIERKKPVIAPRYPTEEKLYKINIEDASQFKNEMSQKDIQLDNFLKNVHVRSTDIVPEVKRDTSGFPKIRTPTEETEYGFWEPDEIPDGKASIKQIIKFISDHQGDTKVWTASRISKEYKLDEREVAHVLEYNKTFSIYIPALPEDKGGIYTFGNILSDAKKVLLLEKDKNKKETDEDKK